LPGGGDGSVQHGGDIDLSTGLGFGLLFGQGLGDYLVGGLHAGIDSGLLLGRDIRAGGGARRAGRGGGRSGGAEKPVLDVVKKAHGSDPFVFRSWHSIRNLTARSRL